MHRECIDYNEVFSPVVKHFHSVIVGIGGTV